ncbi:outer membrane beta-barrel protein [Limibacter armeniacum]|uniref:outer membrane beta-barrel protein n=1 Tax=Limibacter armeniacum TaxID=466084 RepID=UPI002FE69AA9
MKKFFLTVAAVCAAYGFASAQSIHLKVRGGTNVAFYQSDSPATEVGPRIGGHVGAELELGLTDNFSILGGVQYSQQGLKINGESSATDLNVEVAGMIASGDLDPSAFGPADPSNPAYPLLVAIQTGALPSVNVKTEGTQIRNYFNIPVLAQYKLPFGLRVLAGAQAGVLLSGKNDYKHTLEIYQGEEIIAAVANDETLNAMVAQLVASDPDLASDVDDVLSLYKEGGVVEKNKDIKDTTNEVDYSFVAGAGYEVGRFSIDARYTQSMQNLYKEDPDNEKTRNAYVQIGVSYKLF